MNSTGKATAIEKLIQYAQDSSQDHNGMILAREAQAELEAMRLCEENLRSDVKVKDETIAALRAENASRLNDVANLASELQQTQRRLEEQVKSDVMCICGHAKRDHLLECAILTCNCKRFVPAAPQASEQAQEV